MQTLGTHFGVDLMHRKAEIKDIITEVINNMTDDEDEGDDEEAEDKADANDNEWEVNRDPILEFDLVHQNYSGMVISR